MYDSKTTRLPQEFSRGGAISRIEEHKDGPSWGGVSSGSVNFSLIAGIDSEGVCTFLSRTAVTTGTKLRAKKG